MSGMELDPALYEAYRSTRYSAWTEDEELVLQVDEPNPTLERLMRREDVRGGCFVTAWNPCGENTDPDANMAANARLHATLQSKGWRVFEGEGKGEAGDWPAEASFLALGCSLDDASGLCVDFRQNAVLWFGSDAVPRLILHPDLEAP
jgi:hypothetical protein